MSKIILGQDYIFTSKNPFEDEITELDYDDGRLSDEVWDNYDFWSSLDDYHVTAVDFVAGSLVKVCIVGSEEFPDDEWGPEWWFVAHINELALLKVESAAAQCNCELRALMVRGCQCGGV